VSAQILLLGAGFSGNSGGWLAPAAIASLRKRLGSSPTNSDNMHGIFKMKAEPNTPDADIHVTTSSAPPIIESITLRTGPPHGPLDISCGSVTIFAGPNNSGKSLALRNIHRLITRDSAGDKTLVLSTKIHFGSIDKMVQFILYPATPLEAS
jgi:hypothetical protein